MSSGMYTIFDLDSCISDDRRRRKFLAMGYDAYHEGLVDDPVANVDAIRRALKCGDKIAFVTARPSKWLSATVDWINKKIPFARVGEVSTVFMRPVDDVRDSVELKRDIVEHQIGVQNVSVAYDDRMDVVEMYRELGIFADQLMLPTDAADILSEMAETFMARNAVYRDNYKHVAPVIKALWPDGVPPELITEDRWHLFELLVVKLTRFANSGLIHRDSIHDAAIYAAMIESDLIGGKN